ncbi:MAG: hypothetical protein M1826_003765 [Phylliscum demangeonii]|nr:MAG: hypothetical protein M1826_003765 [Phylliscum demangeonii]
MATSSHPLCTIPRRQQHPPPLGSWSRLYTGDVITVWGGPGTWTQAPPSPTNPFHASMVTLTAFSGGSNAAMADREPLFGSATRLSSRSPPVGVVHSRPEDRKLHCHSPLPKMRSIASLSAILALPARTLADLDREDADLDLEPADLDEPADLGLGLADLDLELADLDLQPADLDEPADLDLQPADLDKPADLDLELADLDRLDDVSGLDTLGDLELQLGLVKPHLGALESHLDAPNATSVSSNPASAPSTITNSNSATSILTPTPSNLNSTPSSSDQRTDGGACKYSPTKGGE